jgi:two-component system phosphate regulon response regulator PhoB
MEASSHRREHGSRVMQRILVCISDAQFFLLLRHVLAIEGFDAVLATHVDDVVLAFDTGPVAAVLIAWSSGPLESDVLLARVKAISPTTAVIVLSREPDGQDALPLDCNLILKRPFDPAVLLQFLQRLRYETLVAEPANAAKNLLRFADLEMNVATVNVRRAGSEIALTALQFRLLRRLLSEPGTVCHRETLIDACWPEHVEVELRTVDIHIGHLRRALAKLGPDMIRTVRGQGYALQSPADGKDQQNC